MGGVAGVGGEGGLSPTEYAILTVLLDAGGRVVPRARLARRAGLDHLSPRRADAVVATLRRALGEDAIRTVRGRGWAIATSREPVTQPKQSGDRSETLLP